MAYNVRPRFTVYTDASFEPGQGVHLCYVILSDTVSKAGIASFTQNHLDSMSDKDTYIAHGEAFAPLLAIYHEHHILAGSSTLWFLDNLGVLSCYSKGSSVVADVGCVVHAALLSMAKHRIYSWYEHVDSKANIADGGTRNCSAITDALGIILERKCMPPWPSDTLLAEPSCWLRWFTEQAF